MTVKEAISGLNAMIETQKENFLSLCEKLGYDPKDEEFHVEGEEDIDLGPEFNADEEGKEEEEEEEEKDSTEGDSSADKEAESDADAPEAGAENEEDTESELPENADDHAEEKEGGKEEEPKEEKEEAVESCSKKNPLKVPSKPVEIKPEAKTVKECGSRTVESCSKKNPIKVPAKPTEIKPEAKKVSVKECDGKDDPAMEGEEKPTDEDVQDDILSNFKHSPRKAEYDRINRLTDDKQAAGLTPEEQRERKSLIRNPKVNFTGHRLTDRDSADASLDDVGFEGNPLPEIDKHDVERDEEGHAVFTDALADSTKGKGEGKPCSKKSCGKEDCVKEDSNLAVEPMKKGTLHFHRDSDGKEDDVRFGQYISSHKKHSPRDFRPVDDEDAALESTIADVSVYAEKNEPSKKTGFKVVDTQLGQTNENTNSDTDANTDGTEMVKKDCKDGCEKKLNRFGHAVAKKNPLFSKSSSVKKIAPDSKKVQIKKA